MQFHVTVHLMILLSNDFLSKVKTAVKCPCTLCKYIIIE